MPKVPSTFLQSSIKTMWIPFIQKLQGEYHRLSGARRKKSIIDDLGKGISAMERAASVFPDLTTTPSNEISQNWLSFVIDELARFNAYGPGVVSTLSEAILKALAITNIWQSAPSNRTQIYFRGQINFDWELTPRITRTIGCIHNPNNLATVSGGELDALDKFRKMVTSNTRLSFHSLCRS